MDITTVFLLLTAAFFVNGQDLSVSIEGDPTHTVAVGGSLSFTCNVNQGLQVTLKYSLEWWRQSLTNPEEPSEVVLTNMEALQDAASPDHYGIEVKYGTDFIQLILTVKDVKVSDDGKFICRLTPLSGGGEVIQNDVEVVIVNDVQGVELTFDGEPPVTGAETVAVEREEGDYGVTCSAVGFSPAANIHIFVGEEEQSTGGASTTFDKAESEKAGARRYRAEATAAAVNLRADHTGKVLRCVAHASFEGASRVEASVPLKVIALEPTIRCDKNASARPGDLYVKIKCDVEHSNVQVKGYSWEIGDSGEIIYPGNVTKDYDEVTVQEIDEYNTVVILDLYQAKEWHFDTIYYLDVFTQSGQRFREKATLIRLDPTGTASLLSVSTVGVLCVSFLISLLLSL